jgi:hypothetical protein
MTIRDWMTATAVVAVVLGTAHKILSWGEGFLPFYGRAVDQARLAETWMEIRRDLLGGAAPPLDPDADLDPGARSIDRIAAYHARLKRGHELEMWLSWFSVILAVSMILEAGRRMSLRLWQAITRDRPPH